MQEPAEELSSLRQIYNVCRTGKKTNHFPIISAEASNDFITE